MRTQISTNVSQETRKQANELIAECGYSLRDVVTLGIEKLYQEKIRKETEMSRYGNCVECQNALTKDEGYHVCSKCGGVLCDKCAAASNICSKCVNK